MEQLDRHLIDSAVASAVVRALRDAAVAIVDHDLRLVWAGGGDARVLSAACST